MVFEADGGERRRGGEERDGGGVAVKTAPTKLVEMKILAVKDEVSYLLGLVVFPNLPGLVMSSDLPVGFRGLGGWSTATEPP